MQEASMKRETPNLEAGAGWSSRGSAGFTGYVCADSDCRTKVDQIMKTTEMPSPLNVAARKTSRTHKSGNFSTYGGKKCKTGRIKSTFSRDEQSSGEAEPAGGRTDSAAAVLGGQVTARPPSEARRPSKFIQRKHLSPSQPAGSDGCLRRSVGATLCLVCGECKYISPRQRKLAKQEATSPNPDSGRSSAAFNVSGEKRAAETTEKIVVWINEYPKVTLCDVAVRCHVCRHDCGYILPDDLKSKEVRCFKRDMRAGFRIWPSCIAHCERDDERGAEVKNGASAASGSSICEAESLTEQHKPPEEAAKPPALKIPSKRLYNGGMDGGDSTPASKHVDEEIRTRVSKRNPLDNGGPGCDLTGSEIHRDKRKKLGDGVECSRAVGLTSKKKEVNGRPDQLGDPTESDVAFSESDELNVNQSESSICQRVRPYFWNLAISCARTYMAWPFPDGQRRCKAAAAATSCPETSAGFSPRSASDSITENHNLPSSFTGVNGSILSDGSYLAQAKRMELSVQSEGPAVRLYFHRVSSSGAEMAVATESSPTFPFSHPQTDNFTCTATQSDWETSSALSTLSNQSTHDASSSLSAAPRSPQPSSRPSGKLGSVVADAQLPACTGCCLSPLSSVSLPQHQSPDHECLPTRSPPTLELFDRSPFDPKRRSQQRISQENPDRVEFLLPPLLSPIISPHRCVLGSRSSGYVAEKVPDGEDTPPDFHLKQVVNGNTDTPGNSPERCRKEVESVRANLSPPTDTAAFKSMSSPGDMEVEGDGDKKETLDGSPSEGSVEQVERSSEQVPPEPGTRATIGSDVVNGGSPSSPSSHGEEPASFSDREEPRSATDEGSSANDAERTEREAETAEEAQSAVLDEFTAYKQDILLVDVMQEDPELFENLPEKSLLNLGPIRDAAAPKKKPVPTMKHILQMARSASLFQQRSTPVIVDLHDDDADVAEEKESRPWRPRCTSILGKNPNPCPVTVGPSRHLGRCDGNNNKIDGSQDSYFSRPIQTMSSSHSIPPLMALGTGSGLKNPANKIDFRRQKSNEYCRQYFSESLSCGFKMCRFQHLPVEGDEKFCVETVAKFARNPTCLQKAGDVYTGYYQSSPPGVYFSMPVLLTLLWSLLKAGMVSGVFSVLRVSLAHNIVPGHEFLLALFNYVRDKDLMNFKPELIQLTFKMASVGLELSLDCIDDVKNSPMFQQMAANNSHVAFVGNHSPEFLNLVHGIIEVELCAKQEDWKRMGEVYRSVCRFSQHPNQVERLSGRVAIALLSESKDKLSLPFAAFAETVHQNESEESLVKTFVGRIGVSLMLRYHKNHHWTKGRRVVEVMSTLKVNYATLKSLFGNEDGASRCCLITVATELFLLSGSVEGALNTLREHSWFLSSGLWPCEPADLERRTNVLRRLVEKTSLRDTLEVLCNLPGVKEPSDLIDVSRYSPLFTDHLQVCVERQALLVASDTVDFMLSKKLPVDHSLLQTLLEKLGRQKRWPRARELFKHSLSAGYYPGVSAPPASMALIVPCQLGEVELAITLEMFITFNACVILSLSDAATSSLTITLKRTPNCDGEYISAGKRLLSAAHLPQPKLDVRLTEGNSSQEPVFRLDVSSARSWLKYNHLTAKMFEPQMTVVSI